eukprot:Hpha_TRINITY_DN16908_c0_g8::TRINITY_DN16908_c0_g8_i1::g.53677::m.53677
MGEGECEWCDECDAVVLCKACDVRLCEVCLGEHGFHRLKVLNSDYREEAIALQRKELERRAPPPGTFDDTFELSKHLENFAMDEILGNPAGVLKALWCQGYLLVVPQEEASAREEIEGEAFAFDPEGALREEEEKTRNAHDFRRFCASSQVAPKAGPLHNAARAAVERARGVTQDLQTEKQAAPEAPPTPEEVSAEEKPKTAAERRAEKKAKRKAEKKERLAALQAGEAAEGAPETEATSAAAGKKGNEGKEELPPVLALVTLAATSVWTYAARKVVRAKLKPLSAVSEAPNLASSPQQPNRPGNSPLVPLRKKGCREDLSSEGTRRGCEDFSSEGHSPMKLGRHSSRNSGPIDQLPTPPEELLDAIPCLCQVNNAAVKCLTCSVVCCESCAEDHTQYCRLEPLKNAQGAEYAAVTSAKRQMDDAGVFDPNGEKAKDVLCLECKCECTAESTYVVVCRRAQDGKWKHPVPYYVHEKCFTKAQSDLARGKSQQIPSQGLHRLRPEAKVDLQKKYIHKYCLACDRLGAPKVAAEVCQAELRELWGDVWQVNGDMADRLLISLGLTGPVSTLLLAALRKEERTARDVVDQEQEKVRGDLYRNEAHARVVATQPKPRTPLTPTGPSLRITPGPQKAIGKGSQKSAARPEKPARQNRAAQVGMAHQKPKLCSESALPNSKSYASALGGNSGETGTAAAAPPGDAVMKGRDKSDKKKLDWSDSFPKLEPRREPQIATKSKAKVQPVPEAARKEKAPGRKPKAQATVEPDQSQPAAVDNDEDDNDRLADVAAEPAVALKCSEPSAAAEQPTESEFRVADAVDFVENDELAAFPAEDHPAAEEQSPVEPVVVGRAFLPRVPHEGGRTSRPAGADEPRSALGRGWGRGSLLERPEIHQGIHQGIHQDVLRAGWDSAVAQPPDPDAGWGPEDLAEDLVAASRPQAPDAPPESALPPPQAAAPESFVHRVADTPAAASAARDQGRQSPPSGEKGLRHHLEARGVRPIKYKQHDYVPRLVASGVSSFQDLKGFIQERFDDYQRLVPRRLDRFYLEQVIFV